MTDDDSIADKPVIRLSPQPRYTMTREDQRPPRQVGDLGRKTRESRENCVRVRCARLKVDYERLKDVCDSAKPFAGARDSLRLQEHILNLADSVARHDPQLKKIANLASKLQKELEGWTVPSGDFDGVLEALANGALASSGRGGDRRSGRRTPGSAVHAAIIRLYVDFHSEAGFSEDGPMARFVDGVGKLLRMNEKTGEATRAEYRRLRREQADRGSNRSSDERLGVSGGGKSIL
jgi:hypothetical protein